VGQAPEVQAWEGEATWVAAQRPGGKGQVQEARSALVEPIPDQLEVLGREAS